MTSLEVYVAWAATPLVIVHTHKAVQLPAKLLYNWRNLLIPPPALDLETRQGLE